MNSRSILSAVVIICGLSLLGMMFAREITPAAAPEPTPPVKLETTAAPFDAAPASGDKASSEKADRTSQVTATRPAEAAFASDAPTKPTESRRAQVQANMHALIACQPAAIASHEDREQLWRMTLPAGAIDKAPAQYAAAEAWAREACAQSTSRQTAAADEPGALMALLSDPSPDDPLRRLWEASAADDLKRDDAPAMRALLDQALAEVLSEPSMWELQSIADAAQRFENSGAQLGPFVGAGEAGSTLWRLVACDLGANCAPDSPAARLLCYQEQLCGYGSLEEALIDAYWPLMQIEQLQAARLLLAERLRAGGHGVFEPLAPGSG